MVSAINRKMKVPSLRFGYRSEFERNVDAVRFHKIEEGRRLLKV